MGCHRSASGELDIVGRTTPLPPACTAEVAESITASETRSPVAGDGDAAAVVGELGPTASRLRTGHTDGTSSRTSTAAGWSRTDRAEHLQAEVRAVLRCARS